MEDPLTTAYIDITANEMQKQIDAFTDMMRSKSSENPSTTPRESNSSTDFVIFVRIYVNYFMILPVASNFSQ